MRKNQSEEDRLNGKRRHHYYAPAGTADYTSVDAGRIVRAIEIVTRNGGAIRFGKTRDGGAYAIGIYGDAPEPYTDYLRPTDNLLEYLETLADSFSQLPTT